MQSSPASSSPAIAAKVGYLMVAPWDLAMPGGVAHAVLSLGHEIDRLPNYRVLFLESADAAGQTALPDGTTIIRRRTRRYPPARASARERISFLSMLLPDAIRMMSLLRRHRIGVINVHYPTPESWLFGALKRAGAFRGKLVVSVHGSDVTSGLQESLAGNDYLQRLVQSADVVVACSGSLANRVISSGIAGRGPVHAVHNGFSPKDVPAKPRTDFAGTRRKRSLICVAAYEHKKGIDTLLNAMSRLVAVDPTVTLEVIGGYTPYFDQIDVMAKALKLTGHVTLRTNVPHAETLKAIQDADVLVLPSRQEPFGLVLLEAGFLGTPIVATNVGGIPEVVPSADFGWLVRSESPADLTDAIQQALLDPNEARRRSDNMQERVREQFSWRTAAEQYQSLLS